MQSDANVAACPACDGVENAQVGRTAPAFESLAGGKVFRQPVYAIRHCPACGLYFKSNTLAIEELDEYYARLEFEAYEQDANYPTDQFLRRMLKRLPNRSKVLDFGCSTGRILEGLTNRFECFGAEVSEAAAAIARERGIRIVSEDELRAGEPHDIDAILLTDVYEHLPRPVELVEMLATLLKPGGWLAIVTGNADAIRTPDRIGEFWYFRTPAHFLMSSDRHLQWLASRLDLYIDALHRCSHYSTPMKHRLRQYVKSFAYHQFRRAPRGAVAAVLRSVPVLNRAEKWSSAPALTCTADHVVAVFRKKPSKKIAET